MASITDTDLAIGTAHRSRRPFRAIPRSTARCGCAGGAAGAARMYRRAPRRPAARRYRRSRSLASGNAYGTGAGAGRLVAAGDLRHAGDGNA